MFGEQKEKIRFARMELDNEQYVQGLDRFGMLEILDRFPEDLELAYKLGQTIGYQFSPINHVVIVGLGGSAVSGELWLNLFLPRLTCSVTVIRGDQLPGYLDDHSLVVAVSYSGNTKEVLSASKQALEKGAKLVGITSGGQLRDYCDLVSLPYVFIPKGYAPRAALPFLFFALSGLLQEFVDSEQREEEISKTLQVLSRVKRGLRKERGGTDNLAKKLASELVEGIVIVYATSPAMEGVANRWKTQINENSKHLSFANRFPEFLHNELEGWHNPPAKLNNCKVVLLTSGDEDPVSKGKIRGLRRLLEKKGVMSYQLVPEGEVGLAQLFSYIYLGDYVSVYLALLNGVDPTPVKTIERFKEDVP